MDYPKPSGQMDMDQWALLGISVLSYGIFPFFFALLPAAVRATCYYIFFAQILAFGSFLGAVYSIDPIAGWPISGGNIAYSALMMCSILMIITENNPGVVRNIIYLVIGVNTFQYLLNFSIRTSLVHPESTNPFNVAPEIFHLSGWIVVLGGLLIIFELLLMLFCFQKINSIITNKLLISVLYPIFFVFVVTLDGALFPLIAMGLQPNLLDVIVGNAESKLVAGLAFFPVICLYLVVYKRFASNFFDNPLPLRHLNPFSRDEELEEKLKVQEQFLNLTRKDLHVVAERLTLATDSAGIGIWEYDTAADKLLWDNKTCQIYQVPLGQSLTLSDWLSKIDEQDQLSVATTLSQPELKNRAMTFKMIRADGEVRHIQAQATILKDSEGKTRLLGVNRDITDQVVMAEETAHLQTQLQQAQKMESIGVFSGAIAHDFNNLLIPIIGYSELARHEARDNDSLLSDLKNISDAADRARVLIRHLMAFSRNQVLRTVPLELNKLVEELTPLMSSLAGESIEITTDLGNEPMVVKADRGQLEQCLLNLISNSRDAMPDGGCITLRTRVTKQDEHFVSTHPGSSEGTFVNLSVTDNGLGMKKEVRERIFEPFFTTKEISRGTGLGLATVFGIVKQHEGNIWVHSEPGIGTTFNLHLPARPDLLEQALADQPLDDPAELTDLNGTERILIVEDDLSVRTLVKEALSSRGYEVIVAESGSELLASNLDLSSIDLVITDIMMPGISGEKLAQQLKLASPELKILFMSGYTADKLADTGFLLEKPFTTIQLLQAVRAMLDGKENLAISG